jgi:hypothetical protein
MGEKDQLQFFIESKDFEKLTAAEKTLVLSEITEEEFRSRRSLIINVKSFLSEGIKKAEPTKDIRRNVLAVMNAKKEERGWSKIIAYRIPIYIPAAAVVLLLLMIPFFIRENNEGKKDSIVKMEKSKPEIIYRTKTIEKEVPKIVEVEKVKYITVVKTISIPSYENLTPEFTKEETDYISDPGLTYTPEQMETQLNVVGKSNAVHSELNQFVSVGR